MMKIDWEWLDDFEYFCKIVIPIVVLFIGIFGKNIDSDLREKLIFSGALASGTQTRKKD